MLPVEPKTATFLVATDINHFGATNLDDRKIEQVKKQPRPGTMAGVVELPVSAADGPF
jgi:hypothetical protein